MPKKKPICAWVTINLEVRTNMNKEDYEQLIEDAQKLMRTELSIEDVLKLISHAKQRPYNIAVIQPPAMSREETNIGEAEIKIIG